MFRKELEKIKSYKPGKPIEEVKRSLGLKEVYKLASNEVPFSPLYIKKAILEELKHINRYPQTDCFYLRKTLASQLKVEENQIIFGNGSDEIITFTLRALIDKGDEVIIAYPTFLIYEIQAQIQGAQIISVPLKNYRYDLETTAKKISKKTKVIFIANPDNPTGTYLTNKELGDFLKKIPRAVLVFLDEAYFEFAPSDFPRSKEFLNKRGNIIFTRTFSKVFGLAGLRIGYGVSSAEIIRILDKVREPFNINRFAQTAALAALKDKTFLKKVLYYTKKEKDYLYKELKKTGVFFIESAANFILIDFKKDTANFNNYLLSNGIIIRELKDWGLPNFFRVTTGTHKENKKFIDCFKEYLGNVKNHVKE